MKKVLLALASAVTATTGVMTAQTFTCSTTQYPTSTKTISSTAPTTITTCNYAGEYSVDNFTATGVYQISATGGSSNYITLTDNTNNIILQGNSPITATISSTGLYRIHINTNNSCGTENSCRTTVVSPVNIFTCSTTQNPLTTTTISSTAPTTITTCNNAGEYSVNNFTATGVYTISATGGSANYITITDNSNAILWQGNSPLTVTVSTSGLYRIHINTDNACGTESVCRTTVVTPAPAGPCIQTSQYPSSTVTINSNATTNISSCNYAGEYAVTNFTATGVYQLNATGGSGNYITFTDASNTPIAFGNAPITITITSTGLYRIHYSLNSTCATESSCRVTTVKPLLNCSNTLNPLTTTTISSTAPTTITACNNAGEYSVNNFTATGAYTITATGGSTNYITFTDNSNAILFSGYSPLSVTVSTSGLYRIHINTDNACGTENVCRTTVVMPLLPPSNDDCANAIPITVPGTYTGTTIGATSEPTTVPTCTNTSLTQPGVWYQVTGNGSTFIADLCNMGSWDSKIFVYQGSCGSLTSVGCNDDNGPGCTGTKASIAWCTTPSTTYYILVTGYSSANNFTLTINSFTQSISITSNTNSICAGNSATISAVATPTDNSTWTYSLNPGAVTFTNSTVVTPTVTTQYTIDAKNNKYFMCPILSQTIDINVLQAPASSSISASAYTLTCNTSTADIQIGVNPAGTYSYVWSGSGIQSGQGTPTINVNQAGQYSVSVGNACGTVTNSIMIYSVTPLSASITTSDANNPGCNNGSATVSITGGVGPYTYSWSAGTSTTNVATNLAGTSGSGTTYTVVVIDQTTGCTTSQTFTITCVTGIQSLENVGIVNIYPNPSNGLFTVVTNNTFTKSIKITDIIGRVLYLGNTSDKEVQLNISHFNSGMYILEVISNGEVARFNIIKE